MKAFSLGLIFVLVTALFVFASLTGHWFSVGVKAADAPASIAEKAIDNTVDNSIYNYEAFRDIYTSFVSRKDQIRNFKPLSGASQDELAQERVEFQGQQGSCRDLVAQYNAMALKTNHNVMKNPPMGGPVLPDMLNLQECNV